MTAEQAYPAISAIIQQLQDPGEKRKLETMILGAVESFERRKARIAANLEKYDRYQVKPKRVKSKIN